MTLLDGLGVFGVLLILIAYTGATVGRLDPKKPVALVLNLVGASLILLSMTEAFNLSAFLMEAAWAVVAAMGIFRFILTRRP
jgi:hypothetical protein